MSRLLVCCQQDLPSVNMNACLRAQDGWEELGSDDNGSYCARGDDVIMTISDKHITHENIDSHAESFGIKVDEVVFMSKHSAASGIPTLTVHPIGNFKKAEFGGRDNELVASSPASMGDALRKIARYNDTDVYKVSFEVTHHGPYLEKPTYFIEIGSDASHWGDIHAAEILTKALCDNEPDDDCIVAIGVGGGHYAPRFTEMVMGYRIGIGHMIPGYQTDGMDDETVISYLKAASEATSNTKCVYMHKKAYKKPEERRITGLIESLGMEILSSKDLEPL
ncbi:MAG: D-aminoacyl-tRNA deacylase [Candidatus Methanomethylophilaceae archaeon]|nr:D-aminoacyl-tRNA deacylase [Candidatus Methanomethylophilaceae archaeon]